MFNWSYVLLKEMNSMRHFYKNGCGDVGKPVASDSRDALFESSHRK